MYIIHVTPLSCWHTHEWAPMLVPQGFFAKEGGGSLNLEAQSDEDVFIFFPNIVRRGEGEQI